MLVLLIPKFANTFDFFVRRDPPCQSNFTFIRTAIDFIDIVAMAVVVVVVTIANAVVVVNVSTAVDVGAVVNVSAIVDVGTVVMLLMPISLHERLFLPTIICSIFLLKLSFRFL